MSKPDLLGQMQSWKLPSDVIIESVYDTII